MQDMKSMKDRMRPGLFPAAVLVLALGAGLVVAPRPVAAAPAALKATGRQALVICARNAPRLRPTKRWLEKRGLRPSGQEEGYLLYARDDKAIVLGIRSSGCIVGIRNLGRREATAMARSVAGALGLGRRARNAGHTIAHWRGRYRGRSAHVKAYSDSGVDYLGRSAAVEVIVVRNPFGDY